MKFVTVKRTASKLSQAIIILGIYINPLVELILYYYFIEGFR